MANRKKVRKLENDLAEMEKVMAQLRNIHKKELEWKDVFCEAEKDQW